jgi:metal-responsive CopG/Arc/MetJ family transcriptional regulator
MKTAISIPDDLFAQAEALAHRLNTSRSRLYAEALREYLAGHDPDRVTETLNRVYEREESALDPAVAGAGHALLARVEW